MGANAHVALLAANPRSETIWAVLEDTSGDLTTSQLVELDGSGHPRANTRPLPLIKGHVRAIGFDSDPSAAGIFLGGDFTQVGETLCKNLAWLSFDGLVGAFLDSATGPNNSIKTIQVQPDGRILLGGDFTQMGATAANGVVRLLGRAAAAQTYAYWSDVEFLAYEKLGTATLTARRAGPLDTRLTLPLTTSNNPGLEIPHAIEFAPGESEKNLVITLPNNSSIDHRRRVRFSLGQPKAETLILSRAECELIILDDETPGTRDPEYISPINHEPTAFATQPDGKMLVAYSDNGPILIRLSPDGSIDPGFTTNAVPFTNPCCDRINQIVVAADGKIYVAGTFLATPAGATGRNLLVRLNADGTLDSSFDPRLSVVSYNVEPIVIDLQSDGKILVAQSSVPRRFKHQATLVNYSSYQQPLRLNSDGTLDATFAPATPLIVHDLAAHSDGSVYVAGGYTTSTNRGIYRLNSKAVLDPNFRVQTDGPVYQIAFDPQGDLIAAGDFTSINGLRTAFARIHLPDGRVSPVFFGNADGSIDRLTIRDDGKIYVAGRFTRINDQERYRLARLDSNGSLDLAFDFGMGFSTPMAIGVQLDGGLLAGAGIFDRPTTVDLLQALGIVRLEDPAPGQLRFLTSRMTLDATNTLANIDLVRSGGSAGVLAATVSLYDPQVSLSTPIWIGTQTFNDREFGAKSIQIPLPTNSTTQTLFVRASANNSPATIESTIFLKRPRASALDPSFHLEIVGGANPIRDFDLAPDGSVYLSGDFTSINGFAITNLARLNADLSLDTNFVIAALPMYTLDGRRPAVLEAIAVRKDGRVILGGNFQQVGKSNWMNIAQINPDGTYDVSFSRSNLLSGITPPKQIVIGSDDKALVTTSSDFRRLLPSGAVDKSFANSSIRLPNFALRDGSILAGEITGVRKYSSNGVQDTSFKLQADIFNNGVTQAGQVSSFGLQPDGNILFGGAFARVNGFTNTARIARISPQGVVDTNFMARVGTNAPSGTTSNLVTAIQVLPDGDVLIGGNFRVVEGLPQANLARLSPNGAWRDYFRPEVVGNRVDEFLMLPSGDVLARGSISQIDGLAAGPVFKLHLAEPLPPIVRITHPTNGTIVQISDAIGLMDVRVEAFDPDGFVENTVVHIDDQPIATNSVSAIYLAQYPPLSPGEHKIRAITTDATALTSTNEISFTVEQHPGPVVRLEITRSEAGLVLTFDGQLQSSSDLVNWINEPFTSPHTPVSETRRFYRTRR